MRDRSRGHLFDETARENPQDALPIEDPLKPALPDRTDNGEGIPWLFAALKGNAVAESLKPTAAIGLILNAGMRHRPDKVSVAAGICGAFLIGHRRDRNAS